MLTRRVYVVRVFSIEYKQIVCGKGGTSDNLQIFNYNTSNLIQTLVGHSSSVLSIEMLDEQFMASGSKDQIVIIWDLSSYTIKYTLLGHTSWVTCIKRLSSNLIASGDYIGKINVWNWLNGNQIFKLTGHTNAIYLNSLDLYDDQTLISGSLDQTFRFWNISNGTLIQSIDADISINALAMLKSSELKKLNKTLKNSFYSFFYLS
jgi:WD40 repeat protein